MILRYITGSVAVSLAMAVAVSTVSASGTAASTSDKASSSAAVPFVRVERPFEVSAGLQGRNIALWSSHGRFFNNDAGRWLWQRCRVMTTVEDLYTMTYVLPYLIPMLENAGAYVITPRERDRNTSELVIDGDGGEATGRYHESHGKEKWSYGKNAGFGYVNEVLADRENPFESGRHRVVKTVSDSSRVSVARWDGAIPASGRYAVYIGYKTLDDSRVAHYKIHAADGVHDVHVDQSKGGGTWVYAGSYPFKASEHEHTLVEMSNYSADKGHLSADAVRIGGGYGNVGRRRDSSDDYVTSGQPRYAEGARYYLQWAGVPDSIYSPSEYVSDYNDDYGCRGRWVNWLAGASDRIPDGEGAGIPVDLSFALHSDAGTTPDDTFVGTLGIYSTDGGAPLGDGGSRSQCRDLADKVVSQVVGDIRANHVQTWERRRIRDARYAEARVPQVPAMLLELLSHQNMADMSLGLDPSFRFDVSRAIYKGMLKFLAGRDGVAAVVQPLPVSSFAITPDSDASTVTLHWTPTADPLEPTAMPTQYLVEERGADGIWHIVSRQEAATYTTRLTDGAMHTWRIVALNAGGASFPSEALSAAIVNGKRPDVLIVNGFTRTDGPQRFDYGDIAGFGGKDHGVPDVEEIGYAGEMTEFRRALPWTDDENPGWGASNADYEVTSVAGNTHDYTGIHGRAAMAAGHSFVSSSLDAYTSSVTPTQIRVTDIIIGKQRETRRHPDDRGTRFRIFTPELQQTLCDFTGRGGSVLLSGSYVGTDIWDNPYLCGTDRDDAVAFATDILGYTHKRGAASVTGELYTVPSRLGAGEGQFEFNTELNPVIYAVEAPDAIAPASTTGADVFMRYADGDLPCGVVTDNGLYRTAIVGVPLEALDNQALTTRLIQYLAK